MVGAVDIGGTKIAVGLVDESGRVATGQEIPTNPREGFEAAMVRVIAALKALLRATGCTLTGIGIGCTGPVDPFSGALGNVNLMPEWEGGNPVERLSAEFGVSAVVENDADAFALGEAGCGRGRGTQSLVCITVGTGIGGGAILDGKIYRGARGSHPELGHQVIERGGPLCTCGLSGCWESLASGTAMETWFRENAPPKLSGSHPDAAHICAIAEEGNEWAIRAVEREGKYLGIGIANVITCFVPEAIVLAGGVMQSAHLFLPRIRETVAAGCQIVPSQWCEISCSSLGQDAGLIGAAQVWYHRFQAS
jgi:glucokinase